MTNKRANRYFACFRGALRWTIVCFSSLVDVISLIKTRRWVHGLAVGWMLVGGVWSAGAGQAPVGGTVGAAAGDGNGASVGSNIAAEAQRQSAGVLPLRQGQGQDDNRFGGPGDSSRPGENFSRRAQSELQAIETPLVFGGFSPETVERFGDKF